MQAPLFDLFQRYPDKKEYKNGDLVSLAERAGVFWLTTPCKRLSYFAIPKTGDKTRFFLRQADHLLFFSLHSGSEPDPYDIAVLCEGDAVVIVPRKISLWR